MKILLVALLSGIAMSAFANGTWHGAYIGKGEVVSSCAEARGTGNFVSTISWSGFDSGNFLYYGLKFADSVHVVSDDLLLSRNRKVVYGGSDLINGSYESYEDCPNRDICEGQCCIIENSNDSGATVPDESLGAVTNNGEGRKTYPTKTEVSLKYANGKTVEISWTKRDSYQDAINLEGKITLPDGCQLTWRDKLVYYEDKPEEVKETLECLAGRCRWKDPQTAESK